MRSEADRLNRAAWALVHRNELLAIEERDREQLYPAGFFHWLRGNARIYIEFEDKARQVASMGRRHFAARIIVEGIRWHTLLADKDATFKINNNWIPGMARLAMALNPQLEGMFELRRERNGLSAGDPVELRA